MEELYLFKSQDTGNRLLYAYYKGEFWFYDSNVRQWYISGHVREQYELEAQKDVNLTPDYFTCTGYGYEFVAEYEVPVAVLDALRTAKKILPEESASCADAGPASLEAKDRNVPTFDYSGLNVVTVDTLHLAENIIRSARQKYIVDLAGAVDMAHEELVRNSDGHNQHTEETFVAWCRSVGISKTTAYQLLQVQALLTGATPEEQATLEAASPSLLYAAAKPSAPAELVQAVKDGDITTHKQYQEALDEIRARDAKIKDLLEMSEAADRRAEEEERKRKEANEGYAAAMETLRQAQEDAADSDARARAAENRAAGAQKLADQRGAENTELKAKLRELEARPVEVAVAQPDEAQIEAWRKEGEARILATARDLAGKARQAQQQAECHASDLEDENNRLRDALNRTSQLDQSAAMACGACSAALGAWFESTARDVPADLGPALTRMRRLRLALDIAIENGVWPDDDALDDLGGEAL